MVDKKILIVDDNEDIRTTLDELLTEHGYAVSTAASGDEGIRKASKENPDLVLLDTAMPGMDGIETCRRIKQVENILTKVIMYTGTIDAIDAIRARKFGADNYCVKGDDPEFLINAVEEILDSKFSQKT